MARFWVNLAVFSISPVALISGSIPQIYEPDSAPIK